MTISDKKFMGLQLVFFLFSLFTFTLSIIQSHNSGLIYISFAEGSDMNDYLTNGIAYTNAQWPAETAFYRAPLYNYFIGISLSITNSFYAIFFLQALIASVTLVLVMQTTKWLFAAPTAIICGILYLLYGAGWFWVSILHSTIIEMFLTALFAFSVVWWRRKFTMSLTGEYSKLTRYAAPVLVGTTFTLVCLIRPNFLLAAPLLFIGHIIEFRANWQKILLQLSLIIGTWLLMSLPLIIHNNTYSEKAVWGYTTNGPTTYKIANSEDSLVYNFTYPKGRLLKPTELQYWKKQLSKFLGFWKNWEYPQNVSYTVNKEFNYLLSIFSLPFAALAALFFTSFLFLKKKLSMSWPLIAIFLAYYVSICFFFIIGRFRLPGVMLMLPFAAFALHEIFLCYQQKRYKNAATGTTFAFIFLFTCQPFRDVTLPSMYKNAAMSCIYMGRPAKAEKFYRRANSLKKHLATAHGLAVTNFLRENYGDALQITRELISAMPKNLIYKKLEAKIIFQISGTDNPILHDKRIPDLIEVMAADFNKVAIGYREKFGPYLPAEF